MADTIKRSKAIDIAFSIVDSGETELTYSDIRGMSNADLFDWVEAWGLGWTGREWLQQDVDVEE